MGKTAKRHTEYENRINIINGFTKGNTKKKINLGALYTISLGARDILSCPILDLYGNRCILTNLILDLMPNMCGWGRNCYINGLNNTPTYFISGVG